MDGGRKGLCREEQRRFFILVSFGHEPNKEIPIDELERARISNWNAFYFRVGSRCGSNFYFSSFIQTEWKYKYSTAELQQKTEEVIKRNNTFKADHFLSRNFSGRFLPVNGKRKQSVCASFPLDYKEGKR